MINFVCALSSYKDISLKNLPKIEINKFIDSFWLALIKKWKAKITELLCTEVLNRILAIRKQNLKFCSCQNDSEKKYLVIKWYIKKPINNE